MNEDDLNKILAKPGYGIAAHKGYGCTPAFSKRGNPDTPSEIKAWADGTKDSRPREIENLESAPGYAQVLSERKQIGCEKIVTVRLKFYRFRKADYSRAISEKSLVDGLVYAGLIRDDSEDEILLIDEGQVKVDSREEERTEITLEYPEVDYDNLWVQKTNNKQLGIKKEK
jgi:hypothetical protein